MMRDQKDVQLYILVKHARTMDVAAFSEVLGLICLQ